MFKKLIVIAAVSVIFAGCSSNLTKEELMEDQLAAESLRAEADLERATLKNEQMEEALEVIPSWALTPPDSDATGVYGVGIGHSKDYRTSLRKAQLDAEYNLAARIKQVVSGSERSYNKDAGNEPVDQQYVELIDKLVSEVELVGFESVKKEIVVIDGEYHTYSLLKLPFDEFNKLLDSQKKRNSDASSKAAFDEMERRIRERQDRGIELQKITQDLKYQQMEREEALISNRNKQ